MDSQRRRDGQPWTDRHLWQITPIGELMLFIAGMIIVWLCYRTSAILMPVLVGWLLAYVCHPLLTWAEHRFSIPRPVSSGVLLAMAIASLIALSIWLAPILTNQMTSLMDRAPAYIEQIGDKYGIDMNQLVDKIQHWAMDRKQPSAFLNAVGGVMGLTTDMLLWLFLPPICFFFFAWRMPSMYTSALGLVPASQRARARDLLDKMNSEVGSFLRARVIVSVIIGIMFSVGFYLVDVPYWFVLGIGTGMISMIPYVSIVGWFAAVAAKYFDMSTGADEVVWTAVLLWPSVVYWGVNLIEEWVLLPWIQSREMSLSALTTLIVVLLGGVLAGLMGMLLAVPVAACIKITATDLVLPRWHAWARDH